MDYNLVKVFLAVSEHKSISKAAAALNMSQSGISMALKKLKNAVGTELYQRKGRGIALTSDGVWFQSRFQQASELLSIPTYFQPNNVFCSESLLYLLQDKITTNIHESPLSDKAITDALYSRKVDLVIDLSSRQGNAFISEPIFKDEIVVICRQDHPRIQGTLTQEAYFNEQHIALRMLREEMSAFEYLLEGNLGKRIIAIETASIASIMLLVTQSDKLGTISKTMYQRWGALLNLQEFAFPFDFSEVEYHLTYHKRHVDDPLHKKLRMQVKTALSELPRHCTL